LTVVSVTTAPASPVMVTTIEPYAGNPSGITLPVPQGCVLTVTFP
jgi:hypothetical protein